METPTLILLPGMDGTGALFDPFVAAIGSNMTTRIVRYPAEQDLGYAELEEMARDALPEEGSYIILGESFSGPIAVSLAAAADARLKGLILCCSFVRSPRRIGAWLKRGVMIPPLSMLPQAVIDFVLLGRFRTPALSAELRRAISRVRPQVFRRRLREVLNVDVTDQLKAVGVPVLYLRASDDRVVSSAASGLVKEIAPQTHMIGIEAPHCLLQAAPGEAAAAVMRFVDTECDG